MSQIVIQTKGTWSRFLRGAYHIVANCEVDRELTVRHLFKENQASFHGECADVLAKGILKQDYDRYKYQRTRYSDNEFYHVYATTSPHHGTEG